MLLPATAFLLLQRRRRPILARVLCRGQGLGSPASDFGALEVLGGACIGHTDPYVVAAALGRMMQCERDAPGGGGAGGTDSNGVMDPYSWV